MTNLLVGLVVIVLGIFAGWYIIGNRPDQVPSGTPEQNTATTSTDYDSKANPESIRNPEPTAINIPTGSATQQAKGGSQITQKEQYQSAVSYSESGFIPLTITVRVNTRVTFTNNGNGNMWVASAVHPTHQVLPGFDQLKSVGKGGSYSYMFTKIGTWKYHNHEKPDHTGVIIVTQ